MVPEPQLSRERNLATSCLVRLCRNDDDESGGQLFELLYDDLRKQAANLLRQERPNHTLQPTALVHEAWLRLIDDTALREGDRSQFLSLAARAMRRVLIDHARGKMRDKRGGGWGRIELVDDLGEARGAEHDLLEVDAALARLKEQSEELAKLVELRFFAGLSRDEAAIVLRVSPATVSRMWRVAKAELTRLLKADEDREEDLP